MGIGYDLNDNDILERIKPMQEGQYIYLKSFEDSCVEIIEEEIEMNSNPSINRLRELGV